MDEKEIILSYIYDPKTGFSNAHDVWQKIKREYPKIKLKTVSEIYKSQEFAQIMKEPRTNKEFAPIISNFVGQCCQIDILIYDRYKINNYKYILVAVDVFSRYVSARAITNRKIENLILNAKEIFDEMYKGKAPINVNCDNEFNKNEFISAFPSIQFHFSAPDQPHKNAIVERMNRTIAEKLQKWRIARARFLEQKNTWKDVLPDIISNINSSVNRTIKCRPIDVMNGIAKPAYRFSDVSSERKFRIGQAVRLLKAKTKMTKGDEKKYTKNIYTISRIVGDKYYVSRNKPNSEENLHYYLPSQLQFVELGAQASLKPRKSDTILIPDTNPVEREKQIEESIMKKERVNKRQERELRQLKLDKTADVVPLIQKRIRKANPLYSAEEYA